MKKVLISRDELQLFCESYESDCRKYTKKRADEYLDYWFIGSEEVEDEKSAD